MTAAFWTKRAILVLALSFAIIGGAQYLKTKNLSYAMAHAALWSGISTTIYLVVLRRKLRKHPACAVSASNQDARE